MVTAAGEVAAAEEEEVVVVEVEVEVAVAVAMACRLSFQNGCAGNPDSDI